MATPRGMIASPNTVTMSEPPRSGRCRRKRATSAAAAPKALEAVETEDAVDAFFGMFRGFQGLRLYDTQFFAFLSFLYHNELTDFRGPACTRKLWMLKPRRPPRNSMKSRASNASWRAWMLRERSTPRIGCPRATATP